MIMSIDTFSTQLVQAATLCVVCQERGFVGQNNNLLCKKTGRNFMPPAPHKQHFQLPRHFFPCFLFSGIALFDCKLHVFSIVTLFPPSYFAQSQPFQKSYLPLFPLPLPVPFLSPMYSDGPSCLNVGQHYPSDKSIFSIYFVSIMI